MKAMKAMGAMKAMKAPKAMKAQKTMKAFEAALDKFATPSKPKAKKSEPIEATPTKESGTAEDQPTVWAQMAEAAQYRRSDAQFWAQMEEGIKRHDSLNPTAKFDSMSSVDQGFVMQVISDELNP